MSRMLELPDPIYDALQRAALEAGMTPEAWIAAHLPEPPADEGTATAPVKTLAERFAGHVGLIDSRYEEERTERVGELFADHLAAKRRAGRL